MKLAEFKATKEFRACSVKQRFYILNLIASGFDQAFATQLAYSSTGENARTFSYQLQRQKKIQAALARYNNVTEREKFLENLKTEISAAVPGSSARATLVSLQASLLFAGKKKGGKKK